MNFATTLLRDEPITLAQLSERLGYGSEAAFSRAYKKHFGVAPGAYRRMIERSSSVLETATNSQSSKGYPYTADKCDV